MTLGRSPKLTGFKLPAAPGYPEGPAQSELVTPRQPLLLPATTQSHAPGWRRGLPGGIPRAASAHRLCQDPVPNRASLLPGITLSPRPARPPLSQGTASPEGLLVGKLLFKGAEHKQPS